MLKSYNNTTLNYSPNFDKKKRNSRSIKFIIVHYTGMKKERDAIKKLTDHKSKVSSHYLIKKNGKILTLVPELYIAWHAGISCWKKYKSLNKYSIGIEISNPGHENKYRKFSEKQIDSFKKLSKFLIKKYKIKSNFILGHSDIAPDRKLDPGEKFPWKILSRNKIGYWHDLNQNYLLKKRSIKVSKIDQFNFIKNLSKIGYKRHKKIKLIIKAFQRRFRQELVDGVIDLECLLITNSLIKKLNKLS